MESTSKQKQKNGRKNINSKDQRPKNGKKNLNPKGQKPKQKKPIQQNSEKHETCNWLDLPSDLMLMILMRLSVVEIIETVQKVCSSWHKICKEPLMWTSIRINNCENQRYSRLRLDKVAKIAVDRSCGQLVDISIECDGGDELLHYIAYRSPQLTRLRSTHLVRLQISGCYNVSNEVVSEAVLKLPLLTYIDLSPNYLSKSTIEAIGRSCPLLETFVYNGVIDSTGFFYGRDHDQNNFEKEDDVLNGKALAIAGNMPGLRHLMLAGNALTNVGLRAVLNGCSHLVSLDLRRCRFINLTGDLGIRCSDQIEDLQGPDDSIADYPYMSHEYYYSDDERRHDAAAVNNDVDDDDDIDDDFSQFYDRYDRFLDDVKIYK